MPIDDNFDYWFSPLSPISFHSRNESLNQISKRTPIARTLQATMSVEDQLEEVISDLKATMSRTPSLQENNSSTNNSAHRWGENGTDESLRFLATRYFHQ